MNPSFGYNIQRRRRFVKTLCGKKIRPLSRQEFSEENAGITEKKKSDGMTGFSSCDVSCSSCKSCPKKILSGMFWVPPWRAMACHSPAFGGIALLPHSKALSPWEGGACTRAGENSLPLVAGEAGDRREARRWRATIGVHSTGRRYGGGCPGGRGEAVQETPHCVQLNG